MIRKELNQERRKAKKEQTLKRKQDRATKTLTRNGGQRT